MNGKLPLFWKYSIAISSTVLLFGTLNLLFIRNQVYNTFENQVEKHGTSIAQSIAERSVEPLLYDDLSALNKLISQTKSVNTDIRYIFIIDFNLKIIAHSFDGFIPKGIVEANLVPRGESKSIVLLHDQTNSNLTVRDIAVPIMENQIGTVRVGMSEDQFLNEIKTITKLFLGMVLVFLLLGIVAALFLSYIITNPVKAISTYASKVDFNSLDHNKPNKIVLDKELSMKFKNIFNLTDEIDDLGVTFNQMLWRLQTAYRELKAANESLSHSEKMASVGSLTAGLAHEINNPLAGIRNCIRRIEEKPENISQNKAYIEMMSEALQRIEKVVEGMLNFSRKQEFKFSHVDLDKIIDNSISLVNYQIEKSQIALKRFTNNNPTLLYASQNHLEQVFVNILLNSVDSINEKRLQDPSMLGSISINISVANSLVFIEFSDNGIGVPADKVASIFDPFFTLKKIKQGTGLGLAVSYNIINSHKGQITGWNEASGGFTIAITLPQLE
jgi:two-component system NtrC family sensor kinase